MGAKDRRRWPRYGRGGQRAAKAAAGGGAATKEEPSPAETALAGGKPGEFGPSPAAVRFPDGERGAKRAAKEVFGRDVSNQDLASIVGAPAGSTVSVTGYNGTLSISVAHPSIEAAGRTISKASNGDIIIHNDIFKTKVSGGGFGSEMVGRQMEQAAKLGAKRVDTYAARGGDYVGYKVWPKYGYDGELSSGIRSQLRGASELPASVRNATKISDVYKSKEGIAWWDKNGSGMSMSFDLRPGSYSMKKMASYQAERRARPK